MIPIDDNLSIPDEEVTFATSRSGGPGGQNVNKLETRVTIALDVDAIPISDRQKQPIREKLAATLGLPLDRISVKFKTAEHVGPVGEGRSAAHWRLPNAGAVRAWLKRFVERSEKS